MKLPTLLMTFCSAAALAAAACDGGEGPAPLRRGNGVFNGGGVREASVDAAEDASGSSSGASSSSGGGGGSSSGGTNDAAAEAGLCAVNERFGASMPIAGLEAAEEPYVYSFAITPDERAIVWMAMNVGVFTASRPSESVAFGAARPVNVPNGFSGLNGMALSEDGLQLIMLDNGGTQVAAFNRPDHDSDFDPTPDTAPFVDIELEASGPHSMGWVALGARSRMLVVDRVGEEDYTVQVSDREGSGPWPRPSPRTEEVLSTANGSKTVVGISHDGLTFFVREDEGGGLFAVNRPNLGGTFEPEYARPLEAATVAMPNANCDRLYVSQGGALRVRSQILE